MNLGAMSDTSLDPDSGTFLDPRIKEELERLNTASAEINRLEKQLDESRQQFRQTLTESTQSLNEKIKKCRKSAAKAQGYYVAREEARRAQEKAQEAALRYQRAAGMYSAARETIGIAEEAAITSARQGENEKRKRFDSALQEMLNLSTTKLNAAEKEKRESQREHEERSRHYIGTQQLVDQLAKKFKRSIAKSQDYYELKKSFFYELNDLKVRIEALQTALQESKDKYRKALKNLEQISEDIHHSRQVAAILAESRQSGVGADSNTESDTEHERLDIPFRIAESIDSESIGTDQDSLFSSDAGSVASPTPRFPPSTSRSISGSSLPSADETDNDYHPSSSRQFNFDVAAQRKNATFNRTSSAMKLNKIDDDDDDDDDDVEIDLNVDTDDELDDSDDDDVGKSKREVSRKLRTISIGDLKTFSVFDNANDSDTDIDKSSKSNAQSTTDTEAAKHTSDSAIDVNTRPTSDDSSKTVEQDVAVDADSAQEQIDVSSETKSVAEDNTEVVWI